MKTISSPKASFWKDVINSEIESIISSNTWILADLPYGNQPLGCQWIYKKKLSADKSVEKYDSRLVAQDVQQKVDVDCFDTYAPIALIATIRVALMLHMDF